jgi:exopolysaccharide biosynthesis polyprenyl glycosylphosphotransferase
MNVITRIGVAAPLPPTVGHLEGGDVREAVDDRTRALLGRRHRARRGRLIRRGLVAADLASLSIAFFAASAIHGSQGADDNIGVGGEYLAFLVSLPVWIVVAKLQGLYDRDEERADHSTADDVVGVFQLVTIGAWILLAGSLLTGLADPKLPKLITFWALAILIVPVARVIVRERCRRTTAYVQNTLIVGAGDIGQLIARKLVKHPEYGINVVGFVDSSPKTRRADLPEHLTILGPQENLRDIVERLDVERVIFSFSNEPVAETLELVRTLNALNVQVDVVPRLFELLGPRASIHTIEGLAILGLPPVRPAWSSRVVKRAIDVAGSALALALTAPLFAVVAVLIRRDSRGPVFFRQTRVGYQMREFTALKFRTMYVDTDTSIHREYIRSTMTSGTAAGLNGLYKLDRTGSVTPIGRWLRRTSLDELPQLINVLKGEMSLVGPRPCIPYETDHFEPHQFERFMMPQGLTGLWQVTARANASFGEALDMDVAYVRGWSLGLDLRLLLRTPVQLLRQRGATA